MVGTVYKDASGLEPTLAGTLTEFVLALADTKQQIGMQCSHWITGTPALEAAVGGAALTQDELGHARSMYALLLKFPNPPAELDVENDLKERNKRYYPEAMAPQWDSWLKLVAMNVTLDAVLQEVLDAGKDSSLEPFAAIATKICQEERFHRIFGNTFLERLSQNEEVKPQLQEHLNWAYEIATTWLGPDGNLSTLVDAGILKHGVSNIHSNWQAELKTKLDKSGFSLAEVDVSWDNWSSQYRDLR